MQRLSFQSGRIVHSDGIVRGLDGEIHLNETFKKLSDSELDIVVGASFVSKYQRDDYSALVLPENVGAYGGRFQLMYKNFFLDGEYIHKEQDPSIDNKYIYNNGHASVFNLTYTKKGLYLFLCQISR